MRREENMVLVSLCHNLRRFLFHDAIDGQARRARLARLVVVGVSGLAGYFGLSCVA